VNPSHAPSLRYERRIVSPPASLRQPALEGTARELQRVLERQVVGQLASSALHKQECSAPDCSVKANVAQL
jgi:hypothetical protein